MERRGPWTVRTRRTAYENPWIRVAHMDVTRPTGSDGIYGVVEFQNLAIGVLPLYPNGDTVLVGQHRFVGDYYSWELPEGGGPKGLSALESAKRELKEETGATATGWAEFLRFDVSNSVTDEEAACFLAWGLSEGAPDPDPTELLERRRLPFADLLAMCLDGEIRDSLTIAMATTAYIKASRGLAPPEAAALILK